MVKLDPNAGLDVEFEETPEEAVVPADDTPPANPTQPSQATVPSPAPAAPLSQDEQQAADQEERDAEAAGVNTDEKAEQKARKAEHKALMKDLKELGTLYGGGKTSMINVAERITEAAMKRAISLADAENVYDQFNKAAEAKSTIDDVGVVPDAAIEERPLSKDAAENKKQQIRKVEQFIELGNKFDQTASDLVRRARNIHIKLLEGNRDTVMKGSTYTILVSVARHNKTRKESQGVMTDAELRTHLYVEPKPDAAPADEWTKVEQALDLAGAAAKGGKHRNAIEEHTVAGTHLRRAIEELRACLGEGAPGRLAAMDQEAADKQAAEDQRMAAASAKGKKKAA